MDNDGNNGVWLDAIGFSRYFTGVDLGFHGIWWREDEDFIGNSELGLDSNFNRKMMINQCKPLKWWWIHGEIVQYMVLTSEAWGSQKPVAVLRSTVHFDVRSMWGFKEAGKRPARLYWAREVQRVLKAVRTLDKIRRGAALNFLERKPLEFKSFLFPLERRESLAGVVWK